MNPILSFFLGQWRIILLAAIVGGAWWYVHAIRADNASLTAKLATINAQSALVKADNDRKLATISHESVLAVQAIQKVRADDLTRLNLANVDRAKLTQELRASNEQAKINLARADAIKRNYDERLRINPGGNSARMPQEPSAAEGSASSQSECDAATARLKILEPACKITTIDFNTCRAMLDADTKACGREKQ